MVFCSSLEFSQLLYFHPDSQIRFSHRSTRVSVKFLRRRYRESHRFLDAISPINMGGSIVVLFDFDRTLIEDDSDRWVISHMGLTPLFNQLRLALPWNSLMDRMLEELHLQGKTIHDIAECLKGVPLHPHVIATIRSAHAQGCDLKVVSDSNLFYITTILEHHGIYNCFSEFITNPAIVEGGRLRIFPHRNPTSPHGCDLCPPNLCKGRVIDRIRTSLSDVQSKKIIYVGDGMNDRCPTLKLVAGDCVMPRKNFSLWGFILKAPQLIKAEVYEWDNGEDLARILLELIHVVAGGDSATAAASRQLFSHP